MIIEIRKAACRYKADAQAGLDEVNALAWTVAVGDDIRRETGFLTGCHKNIIGNIFCRGKNEILGLQFLQAYCY